MERLKVQSNMAVGSTDPTHPLLFISDCLSLPFSFRTTWASELCTALPSNLLIPRFPWTIDPTAIYSNSSRLQSVQGGPALGTTADRTEMFP